MAIVISGVNNNDKITAADGTIDLLSSANLTGILTAPAFNASNNITAANINVGNNIQLGNAGVATATTFVGNLTGNVNATSNLLLQIGGSEKFRVGGSGQLGIGGANYGTSGQVLTSGGSGSAATWTTPAVTGFTNGADNRVVTASSASALNAEAGLTFDGSQLTVNGTLDVNVPGTQFNGGTGNASGTDAVVYIDKENNNDWCLKLKPNQGSSTNYGLVIEAENATSQAFVIKNSDDSNNSQFYINGEGDYFTGNSYPRSDGNKDLGYHSGNRWRDVVLSGGIRFGSANEVDYLDDYKEGTFQPYYDSTNSNLTFHGGAATNNSYYYSRSGSYVKIGKRVFFQISLSTNGLTVVGGSGQMRISGLPFTSAANAFGTGSSTYPRAVISCMGGRFNSFTPNFLVVNPSSTNLQVRQAFETYGNAVGGTGGFDTSGSNNRNVIEAYGFYDVSN